MDRVMFWAVNPALKRVDGQSLVRVRNLSFILLVCLLCNMHVAQASSGDESPEFRGCMFHCLDGTGADWVPHPMLCEASSFDPGLPKRNSLLDRRPSSLLWDCPSECRYRCMQAVESASRELGLGTTRKYYGKWPFLRVLGCQEIISVIASLANLAVHAWATQWLFRTMFDRQWQPRRAEIASWLHKASLIQLPPACSISLFHARLRRLLPSYAKSNPALLVLGEYYLAHSTLSVLSWAASAIFHARDIPFTERWDYFLAGAVVALGFHITMCRTVGWFHRQPRAQLLLGMVLMLAYCHQVHSMVVVRFDYGRWVTACLVLGMAQTALWLRWLYCTAHGRQHPGRSSLVLFIAFINLASTLEVLDFAPVMWDLLDAHAVWHLLTIPLWVLWYRFVREDLLYMIKEPHSRTA